MSAKCLILPFFLLFLHVYFGYSRLYEAKPPYRSLTEIQGTPFPLGVKNKWILEKAFMDAFFGPLKK